MFLDNYFRAAGWAFVVLMAPTVFAQDATDSPNLPAVGISEWISIVSIPAVPDRPFSATTMMDNIHTLADGTTVTTKTMTTIARDSKGRTHNENRYYLRPLDRGEGRIRDITIFDPVARTRTTLDPATQQATVVTLPPLLPQVQLTGRPPTATVRPDPEREDLGFSSIEGVSVHGFRRSRTIPPGGDGNDRAITVTDEYWYSEELHMNITVKHTDPRHGTQFVTLTQLKRDEPDPKMFEIPAGYTVQTESDHSPIRIGGGAAEANLIQRVNPEYPALARSAGVQGYVEFRVVIGEDGSVKSVQLVRGHPLLVNAAKTAVLQWKYRPTLLNGNAVSVMAPVIVNFTLSVENQ
jgi:TonB family protein